MPLVELARPKDIESLALSKNLKRLILEFTENPSKMPHLILHGAPGTGKTSSARVIAKSILKNVTQFNYLQLNSSSDRGVQVVRSQILSFASSKSFYKIDAPQAPYKIIFLDESDALTPDAQNALRNMMETYVDNCRFILSCNHYNKIIGPLKSRCLSIEFKPLSEDQMVDKIKKLVQLENLPYTDSQIILACKDTKGDFRIAYNRLSSGQKPEAEQLSLASYLLNQSLKDPLAKVYQIIKLNQSYIESNFRVLFLSLCEGLIETNEKKQSLAYLTKLAQMEANVLTGATELLQLMGWYSYYRLTVLNE